MSRRMALLLLTALLPAGCAQPSQQSHASAAQQAACRQQADQTFQTRNPGASYTADAYVSGSRDTPFSGSGASSDTSSGLGDRYSRDTLYSNCINGIGPPLGGGSSTGAPPTPPPPHPPP